MANIGVTKSIHTVQILPLRSSPILSQSLFKSNSSMAVVTTVRVEKVDYTKQSNFQKFSRNWNAAAPCPTKFNLNLFNKYPGTVL